MRIRAWAVGPTCGLAVLIWATGSDAADTAKAVYPAMAPIGQYMMASPADEVALARSAAPTSIAGDAEVMTLGSHGYETAAKGKNGFVCMVWRSWTASFDDPVFWNPKIRGPICLNAGAVRTILPDYLERTKWVLAGVSKADMIGRTKAEVAAHTVLPPAPGAMSFMMSKQGYLDDVAGHWHPHLMFFLARTAGGDWGADLAGSPVFAAQDDVASLTTFIVPVPKWSDGTPAEAHQAVPSSP
jgi:hypothetical protein